ncbi:MAG: hypothetical protein ACOYJ1_16710 [Peptococcales bacterium]
MTREIERLKQSQEAIQKINEELRERLKVKEQKGQETEKTERKVYPHFPFMKRKP